MGFLEVTNDNLVNQSTRGYESSAFCSLLENEVLTYLPASDQDSDRNEDRHVSRAVEEFYLDIGIYLKGTCNIPKKMMANDQPGPLFFIVVCPKHITVVKTGDMSFNLLDHDKVIAKGFFKKSMYDSRAYIRRVDE